MCASVRERRGDRDGGARRFRSVPCRSVPFVVSRTRGVDASSSSLVVARRQPGSRRWHAGGASRSVSRVDVFGGEDGRTRASVDEDDDANDDDAGGDDGGGSRVGARG